MMEVVPCQNLEANFGLSRGGCVLSQIDPASLCSAVCDLHMMA